MSRTAVLLPTYMVILADEASGALTFCETDVGVTHKAVARDLAASQIPSRCLVHAVYRLDPASGIMTDVTRAILRDVILICRAEGWDSSHRLDGAFERCRLSPVLLVEEPVNAPDPDHAFDIARAESALIERAADRGAALIERAA